MASHEESVAKTTSFGVRATISHEDSMNAHLTHVRDRFNWLTSGETSVDDPDAADADAPGHLNTHKERINWLHNGFDLPRDREAYTEVMGKQLPIVQRIAAAVSFVLFCGIALDVFEVGERPELHASFAEWGYATSLLLFLPLAFARSFESGGRVRRFAERHHQQLVVAAVLAMEVLLQLKLAHRIHMQSTMMRRACHWNNDAAPARRWRPA